MSTLLEKQVEIENKYNKDIAKELILTEIKEVGIEQELLLGADNLTAYLEYDGYTYDSKRARIEYMREYLANEDITTMDIMYLIITTTCSMPVQTIQTIASIVGSLFDVDDPFISALIGAEIVAIAEVCGLYTIVSASNSDTGSLQVRSNLSLEEITLQKIEDTMYLPPMLVQPAKLKTNFDSPYLTQKSKCLILGKKNAHLGNISLDVLNIWNSVEYSIDEDMMQCPIEMKEVDLTDIKYANWSEAQIQRMQQEKQLSWDRHQIATKKIQKLLIENGNKFYIPAKPDKRGRCYAQGYHITTQGSQDKKCIIDLYKKVFIKL